MTFKILTMPSLMRWACFCLLGVLFACQGAGGEGGNFKDNRDSRFSDVLPVHLMSQEEAEYIYNFWDELGEHPLDQALKTCVEEKPGSYWERACLGESKTAWVAEVDRLAKVMEEELLAGEALGAFQRSQEAWHRFRKSEAAYREIRFEGMEGTMYQRLKVLEQVTVLRNRGLALLGEVQALSVDR